jgi:hypothetical protein
MLTEEVPMLFHRIISRIKTRRRYFSATGALLFSACLAAILSGCLSGPDGKSRKKGNGVSVELQILPAALAKSAAGTAVRPTDSIHVRVTAPDMDTLSFGFGSSSQSLSLLDLPPGTARLFSVRLFQGGMLLYSGEATADLSAEARNNIAIHCFPEFSRLSASVHIPLDFPKTVAGGELRLWNGEGTLTAPQTVNGELRNFRLEEVPGNRDYAVSIALWDAAGDTIAKAFKPDLHVPKGQNIALVLPLALTFSQISLAMTVGDPGTTSVVLALPGGKRAAALFGDAVFSELYPIPTTEEGGDNGEWLELFNRVSDTLDVSGCQVVRDAGTSANMNFAMPSGTVIPPGRGLVMGKSGVAFAQVTIGASALSLTNTSARLELNCAAGAARIDTVRYSTSTTDPLASRIATAKVAALKPSRLATRSAADAWCLAAMNPAVGEFAATPGGMDGACGE